MIKFDGEVLLCPACGDTCTHHERVLVHSAPKEDAPGVEVAVSEGRVETSRADRSAFAGRRDDVAIELWCESCRRWSVIRFMQHKGQTLVHVEVTDKRQDSDAPLF